MHFYKVSEILNRFDLLQLNSIANLILEVDAVYAFGNGGSMSIAVHFVQDLVKMGGIRAFALDNISQLTAYSNDIGYQDVFSEQLKVLCSKDKVIMLFGISFSGESLNVVNGVELSLKDSKVISVGLIGREGSLLGKVVDYEICVGTGDVMVAEDVFSVICHYLAGRVREMQEERKVKCQ